MGVDRGFDLYPPLEDSEPDMSRWANFLEAVIRYYRGDENFTINKNNDLVFKQGEGPTLMREAHRFRRFSSKVSGSHAGNVETYLKEVARIAKRYFGERIKSWYELDDGLMVPDHALEVYGYNVAKGVYGWDEVYAARDGKYDAVEGKYTARMGGCRGTFALLNTRLQLKG
ncbi:hypothetical protein DACRYDRAFT_119346 [Dacryopinax primogenitus]|uniref:Uncharacterized protein n=1 Tax=Dacryopinax primogenitus (strain DJM 731) TaxID=1858805 RepID=M5FNM4_DACPD|nr:uncharacterized protein DACRYDRAFT_119346 [Dacryopinax primogenitus]EJT97685.1 hypothetical protein DACRYDRAFT_119346 [Dacryopinax primogenitus]